MDDKELQERFKKERPDIPMCFDTRIDAQLRSLTKGKEAYVMKRKLTFGTLIALALVMTIGITAVVGYASFGGGTVQELPFTNAVSTPYGGEKEVYAHNTMGVAGISLRECDPKLTDKWYNVVPVDLTQSGRHTYRLVASNMYNIGECYVDVTGDSVTVTYATYRGNLTRETECMRLFTSMDEITRDFLNDPVSSFAFGEKMSISRDLHGARTALLFVCNRVTYSIPYDYQGNSLVRYYPNHPDWKAYREGLSELFERFVAQKTDEEATPADLMVEQAVEGEIAAENHDEAVVVEAAEEETLEMEPVTNGDLKS